MTTPLITRLEEAAKVADHDGYPVLVCPLLLREAVQALRAMLAASPQGEGEWIKHDGGPNPVPGKMVEWQYRCKTRVFHGPSYDMPWASRTGQVIYRVTEGVKP